MYVYDDAKHRSHHFMQYTLKALCRVKMRETAQRACKTGRRQVLSGPFPPMLLEKLRKYTQVFPQFFILPERKNPRSKLLCTRKREIFLSGEAKSAEILELYFEHFQRSMTGKDPFSGCRIPILHALRCAVSLCLSKKSCRDFFDRFFRRAF